MAPKPAAQRLGCTRAARLVGGDDEAVRTARGALSAALAWTITPRRALLTVSAIAAAWGCAAPALAKAADMRGAARASRHGPPHSAPALTRRSARHTRNVRRRSRVVRPQRRLSLGGRRERRALPVPAPLLSAQGAALRWSATARSRQYVEARMTPLGTTYHVVAGTADTPPAIPGSVVTYRVRPRYEPQQWSNEVVIGYSRSGLAASIGVGGSGQASKEKHGWKNREPVLTQGEREALEKAEREAREKAEREALEKAEREAREKLEREAREKAEREAREKLEREALEKTEPPPSSPVVSALPTGPAAPAGGWHVVFADAFGAKIGAGVGEDKLWAKPNVNEPAEEGNDLNVYEPQQVRVGPEGLELVAHHEPNVGGTGKNYESGAVYTLGGRFTLHSYSGATFAVECVCKWPRNGGAADPAFWHDGSEGGPEQEVDDFEGFGWNSDGSKEWGVAIPALVGLGGHTVYHTEGAVKNFGFDPTLGFHRYTTVIGPGAAGKTKATEYIDGVLKWSFEVTTPTSSSGQHLILSYALREYPERVLPEDTRFAIRSVAVYQDGNHLGKFVTGGGVASGTIVK